MQARFLALCGAVVLAAAGIVLIRSGPPSTSSDRPAGVDASARAEPRRAGAEEAWQRRAAALPQPGMRAAVASDDGSGRWILTGRVVDAHGRGLAGSLVLLASGVSNRTDDEMGESVSPPLSRVGGNPRVIAEVTAGPAGEWRFELPRPLPPLEEAGLDHDTGYAVLAEFAGHRNAGERIDEAVRRRGGDCEIVMLAGATLRGRVVDADGAPVAGAMIVGVRWFASPTAADGRFRLEARAAAEFDLAAVHARGTAVRLGVLVPLGIELDLGDLTLEGPGTIAGRVLFPDGTPAPHLPLRIMANGFSDRRMVPNAERVGGNHRGSTRSDGEGRFQIDGLRDADFQVRARVLQGEFLLAAVGDERPAFYPSLASAPIDFVLPWCLLLVDAPAEPEHAAAELIVAATPAREDGAPPDDPAFVPICTTTAYWGGTPQPLLFSGPGWLRVQASTPDGRTALARVELVEGTWLYRCSLDFEPAGATGSILIRSRRLDGTRHPWLTCELRDVERGLVGRAAAYERTEEGTLLTGVRCGRWRLTVGDGQAQRAYDYQLPGVFPIEVRAGETCVVDWTPELGAALELLADTDGTGAASGVEPRVRATVVAGPASAGEDLLLLPAGAHRPVPPAAEFQPGVLMKLAGPLPAGDYRLRFQAPGFASSEASVVLVAGEVARCTVRLVAGE